MMNKTFGHGKMFKKRVAFVTVVAFCGYQLLVCAPALAAPQGGVVMSGTAAINQAGTVTTVNQSTNKASINWQSFSTKPNEAVNFNQPNTSAMTLNRVVGNEQSVLEGALNATGKVFLINSNGVLISNGATVSTGGFVASTLNLTDEDFNAGNYIFRANGSRNSVINMGTINADGGYVALLGNNVTNQGVISATKGTVALASGDKISLNFNGDSLVGVTVDEGTLNSLVENKEAIYADGGTVILSAKAADDLLSAQVNNSGVIQARTIDDLKGDIRLLAQGGTTTVSGTLDASAPNGGNGGFIETSGDKVKVADSASITTKSAYGTSGSWLIDPTDFTIAASGGDVTGTFLSSMLNGATGTLTIEASTLGTTGTSGSIYVNDALSWSADTILKLIATGDIDVNKSVTATGANAGLTLNAGNNINVNAPVSLSGSNAALVMNYGGYATTGSAAPGTNYNILTKASYSGAVIDPVTGYPVAQVDPHNPANGGDGVYGSITLSGPSATLSINGQPYTLIHSMSLLDDLDKSNGVTGMYYNPLTRQYDTAVGSSTTVTPSTKAISKNYLSGTNYWDPATQAYDIPKTQAGGPCAAETCYWNPATNAYDLTSAYSGLINRYYWKPSTGKYEILSYNTASAAYWDPSTGTYHLSTRYTGGSFYYDTATATYDKPDYNTANAKYYDPYTGVYNKSATVYSYNLYFDPVTGIYDLATLYAPGGNYAIAQNLDASGTTYTTAILTGFSGTFAGLGNTINNLTINGPSSNYVGLIGQTPVTASTIRDIGLTNANVTGYQFVGALIGNLSNASTVSHAYVEQSSITGALEVGGLLGGAAGSTINSSYANVNITGAQPKDPPTANIGGLIGYLLNGSAVLNSHASAVIVPSSNQNLQAVGGLIGFTGYGTTVTNSYATGDVTGYSQIGGLIGHLGPATGDSVTNSFATGSVTGATQIGGLIGFAGDQDKPAVTIRNCYATGPVTSTWNISDSENGAYSQGQGLGGLIGYGYTVNIVHSFARGDVTLLTTDPNVKFTGIGGLVGTNDGGSVTDSYAAGTVNGTIGNYVGGLVGSAGTITDSYATRDVTGHMQVGGLAGSALNVTNSYATGNVNGHEYVGGLVGVGGAGSRPTPGNIANSWASGSVTGTLRVGGFAGSLSNENVTNSYATGNVTGVDQVGGFAGMLGQKTNISNSWQSGTVTGSTNVGGFVGLVSYNNNTLTNDYWNSDSQANAVGTLFNNGSSLPAEATVTNSQGISSGEFTNGDIAYYLNHTIDQVLADRAAAAQAAADAAAAQAAVQAAEVARTAAREAALEASADSQAGQTTGQALQNGPVLSGHAGSLIEQHDSVSSGIVFSESDSYSAHIKAISVEGEEYQLEDDDRKN
jgi:filamentous hemagglutinin family protein